MKKTKENRGGKRTNAGRKPIEPGKRKVPVSLFVESQMIERLTMERTKRVALKAIESDYVNNQY